jgi:pyrimidine-nucleoside phosphorylase
MNESEMRRAIARKRDGAALDAATWRDVVASHGDGRVDDAQLAALLMACTLRGMNFEETRALTEAFVASGDRLAAPDPRTVDKHSSGGVGDTASLVVVPLVAACGVPVAKLSGRALAHTGGTLDKLEAVAGVRTDLSPERFFACVAEAGCAIAAQSARLVPADKCFYALRDRTATVPASGLIAASIVSKKIAGGAHGIVFDVKVGRGAFLAEPDEARDLAATLVAVAESFGRRARALVTDMNEPLGPAIGTGLEAREARDFLRGTRRDARLAAVCDALARAMLELAGFAGDAAAALARALASGAANERFEAMLAAQGAERGALERLAPHGSPTIARAPRSGYLATVDAVALGEVARDLVARAGSGAGIIVRARTGDALRAGDEVATVYGDAGARAAVEAAFSVNDAPPAARALVYGAIGSRAAGDPAAAGARSTLESR